jgi:adenylate cyclase
VGAETAAGPRFLSPGSYTPRHLAEKILSARAALEGERKQVTVLFADLKGSMELLADRDPEEARRLLDPVLDLLIDAVHRYEGTVNQVLGDGIMALFGAPLAHEDHAVRGCYAALRIQETIRRHNDELRRRDGIEAQVRVGLNSGEVVVRAIGSDLHMDYSAVGQTVHLAARMEQLATPGTIRLTAATLALAEGYIHVKPFGPMPIKGLAAPVEVYELVAAGPVRTRLQAAAARGLTRFVGREAEMAELWRAAEQARAGRGQVVAVVGEPGVGKSRLYYEFVHSHRTHGWLVLEASAVSYGKATTYLPLIGLLRRYFKIDDRDDTRAVRAKVTGTLLTLDEALNESVPALLWLLDALGEDHPFHALEPPRRRQRTLGALRRVFIRESQVQPLLLVFEDLHWIDAETQAFLDALVESLPTAPILLAVNYRPEYQHTWGQKTYYRQLRIDPLPPESAREFLGGLLGADPSVEPLARLLIERTDGNPFFLEESVRTLVEARALLGERGGYRLARPVASIQVPATVQAILAARIDRLPPDVKRLLQAASVVGHDVPFGLLRAVVDLDEDELRRGLAHLQAAEFVYEARLFPDVEYTFKHALTHDVAYGTLLHERRRALHAAIVAAMERLYADRPAEQVEVLAHHAERGEVWDQAARYCYQAGVRAAGRSAYREAASLFERALAALARLPETDDARSLAIDVHVALGPVLIALHGQASPHVEASYLRARALCERIGERSRLFPVVWGLWFVNNLRGRYAVARAMGEELLEVARRNDDPAQLLQAHHALWPILFALNDFDASARHIEQGLALYDVDKHRGHAFLYGNHDPGVCGLVHDSRRLWLLGSADQARTRSEQGLRLARQVGHPYTTTLALYHASILDWWCGDARAAGERAAAAVAIAEEHQSGSYAAVGARLLVFLTRAGVAAVELPGLDQAVAAVKASAGAPGREVLLGLLLAEAYTRVGETAKALEVLADALSLAERGLERHLEPELHRRMGELLVRSGKSDDAEATFRRALEATRGETVYPRLRSLELRAATSLARLLAGRGRREEARQVLAPVYAAFTEGFATADLRAARALLDQLAPTRA